MLLPKVLRDFSSSVFVCLDDVKVGGGGGARSVGIFRPIIESPRGIERGKRRQGGALCRCDVNRQDITMNAYDAAVSFYLKRAIPIARKGSAAKDDDRGRGGRESKCWVRVRWGGGKGVE